MKILIACEESQIVTEKLRNKGIEAYSCDIQETSGNLPQYHFKDDVFNVINKIKFDCMIAFPPCTHLASSGAAWFDKKRKNGQQQEAINFFLKLANCNIKHIAIENPVGIMSKIYKPPTQIIQPYFFGDKAQKTTCLWLKNLPKLYHNDKPNLFDEIITHTEKGDFFYWTDKKTGKLKRQPLWFKECRNLKKEERSKKRSKTFNGIATAMSDQWSDFLLNL